jgi:hypothetical protein
MMNGKNNSQGLTPDGSHLVENLNNYIQQKAIEVTEVNYEVKDILNLTEKQLRNLTEQECLEKAFCLIGYCDYIHILHSQSQTKLDWCNNYIALMISECKYPQYTKWEMKLPILIRESELAAIVSEAKEIAQSRAGMLKEKLLFMQDQVDILKKLAYTKRNRR